MATVRSESALRALSASSDNAKEGGEADGEGEAARASSNSVAHNCTLTMISFSYCLVVQLWELVLR